MKVNPYQALMDNAFVRHHAFRKEWQNWAINNYQGTEPEEITQARKQMLAALDTLFDERIIPLRKKFAADKLTAIDDVLDFLEVNIPVFRCGYQKEYFLHRLKFLPLTDGQKSRLLNNAYRLCLESGYRRELAYYGRLISTFADDGYVQRLKQLTNDPNEYVRLKGERLLQMIVNRRPDLQTR